MNTMNNYTGNNLLLYLAEVALEMNPTAAISIENSRSTKSKNDKDSSKKENSKNTQKYHKNSVLQSFIEDIEYTNLPVQFLQAHKEEVKPEYQCEVLGCKKIYTSKTGFHYHKNHGHKNKEKVFKPYKCEFKECDKTYKNANGLVYHYKVAHDD